MKIRLVKRTVLCSNLKCKKLIEGISGVHEKGFVYCSERCAKKDFTIYILADSESLIPEDAWARRIFGVVCGNCNRELPYHILSSVGMNTIDLVTKKHKCVPREEDIEE